MIHGARALGLGVMLGCMNESSLGIAAACAIASLCDYVDLDTNLMLADDPWIGLDLCDGAQRPSMRAGLGLQRA
jgi:L-alanine-DL-glutamate epimerase-like enolase superfamily enzyme